MVFAKSDDKMPVRAPLTAIHSFWQLADKKNE
jgi:hypothetical protein